MKKMNEFRLKNDLEKDGSSKEEAYFYELNQKLKKSFQAKRVFCVREGIDRNNADKAKSSQKSTHEVCKK